MKKCLIIIISIFAIYSIGNSTDASTELGTIQSSQYAWGENSGWINFGCTHCNITISDTEVTGYAWSSQYGWLNLAPTLSGIKNDGEGNLSGYGWSSKVGWINFFGVIIDESGIFHGIAEQASTTVGRISFDCSHCAVSTDWRPLSVRTIIATTTLVHRLYGYIPTSTSSPFIQQPDPEIEYHNQNSFIGSSTGSIIKSEEKDVNQYEIDPGYNTSHDNPGDWNVISEQKNIHYLLIQGIISFTYLIIIIIIALIIRHFTKKKR